MSSPQSALLEILQRSPRILVDAALRLHRAPNPAGRQKYSEAEVEQMCEGFRALLVEALEQNGSAVRAAIMETMIPGLLARGETPESIVAWNGGFMVLLACELVPALPVALRDAGMGWLMGFAGGYVADVARASHRGGESAAGG